MKRTRSAVLWATAALLALAACQQAPEGGWGPVADLGGEALRIVPADGQPHSITAIDGSIIVQPIPAADGSGFSLAGVPLCPGSQIGPISLRSPTSPRPDSVRLFVVVPFTGATNSPGLLDCYARAFAAKGIVVQRDGNILNAALPEGHLTIVVDPAKASGEIRLRRY